jgi:hypothetical protein
MYDAKLGLALPQDVHLDQAKICPRRRVPLLHRGNIQETNRTDSFATNWAPERIVLNTNYRSARKFWLARAEAGRNSVLTIVGARCGRCAPHVYWFADLIRSRRRIGQADRDNGRCGSQADVRGAIAYAADCLPRLVLLGSSENSLLRETIAVIFPAAKIIFPASGGSCERSVVVSRRWSASGCDAIHPPPGRSRSVEATVAIPAANRQHEGV